MRLKDIIAEIEYSEVRGDIEIEVSGLAYDSRKVHGGDLFICIRGFKADGHAFAKRAEEAGACAVLVEEFQPGLSVTQVLVDDTRVAMARAASAYHGYPTKRLKLIGVTGTNGKTTTTFMIERIFRMAGYMTGLIGTIEYRIGDKIVPVDRTTPESLDIQQLFATMVSAGVEVAIIEVSSHAIDLSRIEACEFDALVFTNLSQDHLDYHGTLDEYFRVKRSIFEKTTGKGVAHIVNFDDEYGRQIAKEACGTQFRYSTKDKVEVYAEDIVIRADGSTFTLHTPTMRAKVSSRLPGMFNIHNALAAAGAAHALGVEEESIKGALENLNTVPGRFERVDCGQEFSVIVDYAHTPDGLEKALRAAREITSGRLIAVFGCGGDRDKGKRPLMGKIGVALSDYAILTSDNPRSENPLSILEEIAQGAREGLGNGFCIIESREQAIKEALANAQAGDSVVIAGKGHEVGQEIAGEKIPFDDREVVRRCLEGLKS